MKIKIKVVPNSKKVEVIRQQNGDFKVKVDAPPKEGKANKRLIEILAKYFSLPKSSFKIIHGLSSKEKVIEIDKI